MAKEKADAMDIFGLTVNQSRLLFSIEKYLVGKDIENSKKDRDRKIEWLRKWEKSILDYLQTLDDSIDSLYGLFDIHVQVKEEKVKEKKLTWYYFIVMEAMLFHAYSPVDDDIKRYKGLKYKNQLDDLKEFIKVDGLIDSSFVDTAKDSYNLAVKKISGNNKRIFALLPTIALAIALSALCSAFAGPIAIMLVGGNFAGLSGAALTSASLALLGGGAIAAGGAGMAGGTAVIVGGGALLGFVTGGTASAASLALLSAPEYVVIECAKIEVAIQEILIKSLNDVSGAKSVLEKFKDGIDSLEMEIKTLEKNKEKKSEVKKIKKSLLFMQNTANYCEDYIRMNS